MVNCFYLFLLADTRFLTGPILQQKPYWSFYRVILCGSILELNFPWHVYIDNRITERIVNDCGNRDIWPVLAQSLSWGYGASGVYGFESLAVANRYHPFSHSDYFTKEFTDDYWLTWFRDGKLVPGDNQAASPWYYDTFGWKGLKFILLAAIVCLCILAFQLKRVPNYNLTMTDYLNARDAVGANESARKEFFDNYAPRSVKWKAFVVREAISGYYIAPTQHEEAKALRKFDSSEFQPMIPKGRYISFEGVVMGDLPSGILSIEKASNLRELQLP